MVTYLIVFQHVTELFVQTLEWGSILGSLLPAATHHGVPKQTMNLTSYRHSAWAAKWCSSHFLLSLYWARFQTRRTFLNSERSLCFVIDGLYSQFFLAVCWSGHAVTPLQLTHHSLCLHQWIRPCTYRQQRGQYLRKLSIKKWIKTLMRLKPKSEDKLEILSRHAQTKMNATTRLSCLLLLWSTWRRLANWSLT